MRARPASYTRLNTCLCISFGGLGEVQKSSVPCPTTPPDFPTSVEEDAVLHQRWQQGDLVYYSVWARNCNTFTGLEQNVGTGHGINGGPPHVSSSPGACTRTVTPCTVEILNRTNPLDYGRPKW